MEAPIIQFKHVNICLGTNLVLRNLSLRVPSGACVGIIGPNGSGKTTLLRTILGLIKPASGSVEVLESDPSRLDRRSGQIGYVPQVRYLDRDFPISIYDVVMQGRVGKLGLFRRPVKRDREVVSACLAKVGLTSLAEKQIGALSGGQQQRAFIARALAQESALLLLDEPATGLDIPSQQGIYELLEELHQEGVTTVTTTHDLLALDFHRFGLLACVNKELVAFGSPREVLTQDVLAKTFSGFPIPLNKLWTSAGGNL